MDAIAINYTIRMNDGLFGVVPEFIDTQFPAEYH